MNATHVFVHEAPGLWSWKRVSDRFHFTVGEIMIPSVTEELVKSLGKIFDSSPKDSAAIKQTKDDLTTWLTAIDRSGLPPQFKAWIYQHGVLPRIPPLFFSGQTQTSFVYLIETLCVQHSDLINMVRKWFQCVKIFSAWTYSSQQVLSMFQIWQRWTHSVFK